MRARVQGETMLRVELAASASRRGSLSLPPRRHDRESPARDPAKSVPPPRSAEISPRGFGRCVARLLQLDRRRGCRSTSTQITTGRPSAPSRGKLPAHRRARVAATTARTARPGAQPGPCRQAQRRQGHGAQTSRIADPRAHRLCHYLAEKDAVRAAVRSGEQSRRASPPERGEN